MACSSVAASPAGTASTTQHLLKEHYNGLRRSDSGKDLRRSQQANIRRSYSDDHLLLCKSVNCNIRACSSVQPKLKSSRSFGFPLFQMSGNSSFIPDPVKSLLLFDPLSMASIEDRRDQEEVASTSEVERSGQESNEMISDGNIDEGVKRANWVERLLEIRSHWRRNIRLQKKDGHDMDSSSDDDLHHMDKTGCDCDDYNGDDESSGCMVDYNSSEEEENEYNERETFSRLLTRVPWSDTKLFSKLAFLCNMAYVIPDIKANDLKRHYGLQFVTSSLEKKAEVAAMKAKLDDGDSTYVLPAISEQPSGSQEEHKCRPEVAYEIAVSAASYVQSRAKEIHSDQSSSYSDQPHPLNKKSPSEVAAYVAASTMTAVVAAGEKDKQETANNLQSLQSSPCEWFICDDSSTYTRSFVIQGSDSFASWQANLFFEPAKFEGTDVLVHRGIYEAAKGIYDQFMPEIMSHLERYGDRAKLQFTGHSLGGSLSLLIHLMLLTRKVVTNPSILRPVVTFGSPFVFCGGKKVLSNLGLDESHIHSVIMHRDIVPRAFSCNYPDHVALLLKRLNGTFRSHPCLNKQKMLYSPLGKLFILQPEEESSPAHPLMPSGSGFYTLDDPKLGNHSDGNDSKSSKGSALKAFLNRPHPLETLSNPTAYGSEGTILRDHDSGNYLKALHGLVRQKSKATTMKAMKQLNNNVLWPLLKAPSPHSWDDQYCNITGSNDVENKLVLVNNEVMTGA
ncbi:unnamed protein product [Linum tenue]|uniref:Fungal lipase-type domain-containing protein n=1 Tax=Linum tenue TaxID=586396 RepID=A0AAV0KQK8_9ROSI|nr:unnamed protein product [Linum tenue]